MYTQKHADSAPCGFHMRSPPSQKIVHFPYKLYDMLEFATQMGMESVVSWTPDGAAFAVHDREQFFQIIIPAFFKQTKFRSFMRQLNLWGFKRDISEYFGPDVNVWRNEHFVRGHRENLKKIVRVEIKGKASSAAASSQTRSSSVTTDSKDEEGRSSVDASRRDSLESNDSNLAFSCNSNDANRVKETTQGNSGTSAFHEPVGNKFTVPVGNGVSAFNPPPLIEPSSFYTPSLNREQAPLPSASDPSSTNFSEANLLLRLLSNVVVEPTNSASAGCPLTSVQNTPGFQANWAPSDLGLSSFRSSIGADVHPLQAKIQESVDSRANAFQPPPMIDPSQFYTPVSRRQIELVPPSTNLGKVDEANFFAHPLSNAVVNGPTKSPGNGLGAFPVTMPAHAPNTLGLQQLSSVGILPHTSNCSTTDVTAVEDPGFKRMLEVIFESKDKASRDDDLSSILSVNDN